GPRKPQQAQRRVKSSAPGAKQNARPSPARTCSSPDARLSVVFARGSVSDNPNRRRDAADGAEAIGQPCGVSDGVQFVNLYSNRVRRGGRDHRRDSICLVDSFPDLGPLEDEELKHLL